jgi:hypothetical protein
MAVDQAYSRYSTASGALGDRNDSAQKSNRSLIGRASISPYTGGNFYVVMRVPEKLFPADQGKQFEDLVLSSVRTFSPHSITLTSVEDTYMGGLGANFINGRVDITREFTMTFREYQGLPITTMFRQWIAVSNHYYGTTSLDGDEVIPSSYKGDCFVIITKPSVSDTTSSSRKIGIRDVEDVFYYQGVFPTTTGIDVLNQDINSSELVEPSISFKFDGAPMDKSFDFIAQRAVEELASRMDFNDMYIRHYDEQKGPFANDLSPEFSKFKWGARGS